MSLSSNKLLLASKEPHLVGKFGHVRHLTLRPDPRQLVPGPPTHGSHLWQDYVWTTRTRWTILLRWRRGNIIQCTESWHVLTWANPSPQCPTYFWADKTEEPDVGWPLGQSPCLAGFQRLHLLSLPQPHRCHSRSAVVCDWNTRKLHLLQTISSVNVMLVLIETPKVIN